MYEELVGDLRYCGKGDCNGCRRYTKNTKFCYAILCEAADAIEELSKQIEAVQCVNIGDLDCDSNQLCTCMGIVRKQLDAYAKKPSWIPVTEALPKEDCHVLAYYGFNRGDGNLGMMFMQVMDYYTDDPRPHFQHEGLNGLTVTHWMPLPKAPEPPKEEIP